MVHRLDILDRLHRRLLEIVGTALPLLASSMSNADLTGLAHLRSEMVAAIDSYARYTADHVVADAVASDDPERMRQAHEIRIGSIALERTYQVFTRRWIHRDTSLNWPEYRLSAIVMMKQIRDQVRIAAQLREGPDVPGAVRSAGSAGAPASTY